MTFDPKPFFACLIICLLLSGCATTDLPDPQPGRPFPEQPPMPGPDPEPGTRPVPKPKPVEPQVRGLVPPHMQDRNVVRIALLLPFSSSNKALAEQAQDMLDAAELAVFESGDQRVVLIPKDTGGSTAGGRSASASAIKQGAHVLLGPLLSRAVKGASGPARAANVPVIAFSNDQNVAGRGVYLMSFQPEPEVDRITDFAAMQGHETFALLRGQTRYGQRVETAFRKRIAANAATLSDVETYPRATREMNAPAARLAHVSERETALDLWQAAGGKGDPALDPNFEFELPYTAVLLPEQGVKLQSLAPLLPYYDVDPKKTRFLGTGLWFDDSLNREPALMGGWFAGPDQAAIGRFRNSFTASYGREPKRLAGLTYDALRVAGIIAESADNDIHIRNDWLLDARGFRGANGLFRFHENGLVEHALAIYEVKRGRFEIIDPAPAQFDPEAF